MAGKGGGAWKVAYADFVTAMMAFFLVMWLVASSNKPTKEAIASYFRDPFAESLGKDGTATGGGGPPISEGSTKEIRVALSSPGPKGSMQAKSDDPEALAARQAYLLKLHDGARTTVGTVVTFVEDSAELDEAALTRLTELAPLMRGKPNKIEIRGHSSKRPLPEGSPFPDTWKLCYARCQATMEFLEQHGLEPERMRLSQAGAFEPHTQSVERDAQARNARVEVYLLGEHVEDLKGTRKEREKRVEAEKSDH